MPQLICLVQRLTLRDGKLVREKETFEVDEPTAAMYVKGGIAKPVEQPVKKPEPVKEVPRDPVQTEPAPAPTPKVKADQPYKKKPGR